MKTVAAIVLWLSLVLISARWVPDYRILSAYEDLLPASVSAILKQPGIEVDVFAEVDSAAFAKVNNFLKPLRDINPEITVNLLPMADNVALYQQHRVSTKGEMLVRQGQASFQLKTLSYEQLFNGLKKINQNNQQWIVILDGLAGKAFESDVLTGLSRWVDVLQAANYRVAIIHWRPDMGLPNDVSLVVLPAPSVSLRQSDIEQIQNWMDQGIALWWMTDPAVHMTQAGLSLLFDLNPIETEDQSHVVLKTLPEHPINDQFDRPLNLVEAVRFETGLKPLWQDLQQRTLAATSESNGSRMLVTGDSDFLSNTYLMNGGNLEMSLRMVDWLLGVTERIDMPGIGLHRSQLHYTRTEVLWSSLVTVILWPLLLLALAGWCWYKQRKR